jgi:NTP pyrophosphatase (non-canonical NTP hydrolase)
MPTSKELIEMAHIEWQNREERKEMHDRLSWTSGWISGYLTRQPQAERLKDCKNCHLPCTQTGKEIPFYGKCPEFRFGKQTPSEGDLVVRESVKRFAVLMETKLRKNDYKSHWSKESFTYLFSRLDEEMKELNQAVSSAKTDPARITDEAIDVANFLMMIVDNLKELREGKDGE